MFGVLEMQMEKEGGSSDLAFQIGNQFFSFFFPFSSPRKTDLDYSL